MASSECSDSTWTTTSTCLWVRSKAPTCRLLLLGAIVYASIMLSWCAYRIGAFSSGPLLRESGRLLGPEIEISGNGMEENGTRMIEDFSVQALSLRNLQCIGWRSTDGCSPEGVRRAALDRNCSEIVPNEESGYCEVLDVNSGKRFRTMRRHCSTTHRGAQFRCKYARNFVNFRVHADRTVQAALKPSFRLPNVNATTTSVRNGIVMVVYPKLLASAYATIRVLRNVLNSKLPIEIWFRPDEIKVQNKTLEPLRYLAETEGNIMFEEIHDPRAQGFVAKIHAIYHSKFDRVLFLDADNVPVRDPSFLFESPEFLKTGAIFWPDFWHPDRTVFGVRQYSLLWELLDMPFVDMFEQESGQVVVDRRRHAAPLELVRFYALYRPNFFSSLKLVWGDKDLFRLAWLKLDVPFTMIQTPPGMAGVMSFGLFHSMFCGMTMVQHDADGQVLFMHRNQHKLTGQLSDRVENESAENDTIDAAADTVEMYADPVIWTHLLRFNSKSSRKHYVIQTFKMNLKSDASQKCYGRRDVYRNPHFYVQEIAALNISSFELQLRNFALESTQLSFLKGETSSKVVNEAK